METSLKECRCCMDKNISDMIDLLDDGLMKLLWNCTGIQINKYDQPISICTCCHLKLLDFGEFRDQCLKSDATYRGKIELKCEPLHEYDLNESALLSKGESIYVDVFPSLLKEEGEHSVKYEMTDTEGDSDKTDDSIRGRKSTKKAKTKTLKKETTKSKKSPEKTETKEIYPCTHVDCTKKFFIKRNLDGHLREHEGLKPALCEICGKEFTKWSYHDEHVKADHENATLDVKCDFENCDRAFISLRLMKRHKRAVHTHKQKPPSGNAFVCHECGKAFSESARLKKHIYTHWTQKPFQCLQCPRSFVTKDKLKNHTMRHDGIKKFVCSHCGMRKTTREELRVHINCHTREKTFTCIHCSKVFIKIVSMKRHIKLVHEGVRDYHCTYCDQSFGKSETLKNHIMTHTGEKPHKCTMCDRAFIQQSSWKAHMATHQR